MIIDDFNLVLDGWIAELDRYSFELMLIKPGPDSWSLGQLYMHLIEDTWYYLKQARACLGNNENAAAEMAVEAKKMFAENAFPVIIIKGDPLSAGNTPQPADKLQLLKDFQLLKKQANELWASICLDTSRGKTPHPGLGYFNAREWMQYAEMHLRHHYRQRKRIDAFLHTSG